MKITKIVWMTLLAMASGCTNEAEQSAIDAVADETEAVRSYVEIGASVDEQTSRVTVDENLKYYWELGDQILALQAYPGGGAINASALAETLTLKDESAGSAHGYFTGELTTRSTDSYRFAFTYPATQSSLETTRSTLVSDIKVACSVTVPAEQDGHWTPYMWAQSDACTPTELDEQSLQFHPLTSTVTLRVFDADGKTPMQIASARIIAKESLVGTFSATTTDTFGDFSFTGASQEVTATGLESIAPTASGYYDYHFAIVPGTYSGLTFELTATDGSVIRRTSKGFTIEANHRRGFNLKWDASVEFTALDSWYNQTDATARQKLAGSTLYIKGVSIAESLKSQMQQLLAYIDGVATPITLDAAGNATVESVSSGEHSVYLAVELTDGTIVVNGTVRKVTVSPLPTQDYTVATSYNSRSYVSESLAETSLKRDNNTDGQTLTIDYNLGDAILANGCGKAVLTLGTQTLEGTVSQGATGHVTVTATSVPVGGYTGGTVTLTLGNGYELTSSFDAEVTGIPMSYQFYGESTSSVESAGWTLGNCTWSSSYLNIHSNRNTHGYATKQFCIPEEVSATFTLSSRYYYALSLTNAVTGTIYVTTTNSSQGVQSGVKCEVESTVGAGTDGRRTSTGELTFTSANSYLSIMDATSSSSGTGPVLYSITVEYK